MTNGGRPLWYAPISNLAEKPFGSEREIQKLAFPNLPTLEVAAIVGGQGRLRPGQSIKADQLESQMRVNSIMHNHADSDYFSWYAVDCR